MMIKSAFIDVVAAKAVTSMSQQIKLFLINSGYHITEDDLFSSGGELYRVIDVNKINDLTDGLITFMAKNVGFEGEIDNVYSKLEKIEEEDK